MDKNRLIQQIDNLKNDIQNLINMKKEIANTLSAANKDGNGKDICTLDKDKDKDKDKVKVKVYNEDKKVKMAKLKQLTDELNNILKQEKIELQNKNELRNITKTIDNLEYQAYKKKSKTVAIDNVNKIKEIREQTKSKYLEYLELEKKYLEYDPKDIPGYLFLHSKILKEYGLCPYMEINENEKDKNKSDIINKLEKNRLQWLNNQKDKGELYFNLYDDLINKITLKTLNKKNIDIQKSIDIFIYENLSESQFDIYNNCVSFIKEWMNCRIKTKRIKDKYKNFINNLSILYNETSLKFHMLLSIKYNIQISINHFDNLNKDNLNKDNLTKDNCINVSTNDRLQNILLVDEFNKYIEDYNINLELMNTNEKYIKNTINQLKCDLWLFLTDKKSFNIKIPIYNIHKHKPKNQVGKYFKKWSQLSQDEQLERFDCFSKYYVQTIQQEQQEHQERQEILSSKLYELLANAYISKNINYRDFKWNIKTGCIEKINKLKYDKENGFVLYKNTDYKNTDAKNTDAKNTDDKNTDDKNNKQNPDKDKCNSTDNDINIDDKNNNCIKKKISYKTIININTEKIINEEILCFILKRHKINNDNNNNDNDYEKYKSDFLEIIKIKLKIRKISSDDKVKIYKIYDEMYNFIKSNQNCKIE